jgi:hypothetical protein
VTVHSDLDEALKDTKVMLNHGDRIDWVLQDDVNMMGGVGEVRTVPIPCTDIWCITSYRTR